MKNFIIGKVGEDHRVMILWDTNAGTVAIRDDRGEEVYEGLDIFHGIEGQDEVHWQGEMFTILKHVHNYFVEEFAPIDPLPEYISADGWCKKKGRKVKNARQFMYNWLARTKGGKAKRGGVKY